MTDITSAAPSDAELFPLIEKHFGMVPRRDDTVIDRRNGRFHDAQRYRDFAADLVSARAQPTPPAVVEPLTEEQICNYIRHAGVSGRWGEPFADGVRWAIRHYERTHGIGVKKGDGHA